MSPKDPEPQFAALQVDRPDEGVWLTIYERDRDGAYVYCEPADTAEVTR